MPRGLRLVVLRSPVFIAGLIQYEDQTVCPAIRCHQMPDIVGLLIIFVPVMFAVAIRYA